MQPLIAVAFAMAVITYLALQLLLRATQNKKEPYLLGTTVPFLDSALSILRERASYLANLRTRYSVSIHTLRIPFQRVYVVHAPHLIQIIQSKANTATFIPNLLDFGILFSGLNKDSQKTLRNVFRSQGNGFTMSVHKYLLSDSSLKAATKTAVDGLNASLPNHFEHGRQEGLMELMCHELTLAMTGAIYGPENPYDDPEVEASWCPFPYVTARKALRARSRVIDAFRKYLETGGHLQAFPMVPEMYEISKSHSLVSNEAAKMEMATSIVMLSSGAVTTFWLMFHMFFDTDAMRRIQQELHAITKYESKSKNAILRKRVPHLSAIREGCPTLVAMLNESLRYHSTVINIKQVKHDTTLDDQYLLVKQAIVMIPGQSIHHNTDIWGATATTFDHMRFLSAHSKKNLSSTSAFRPFSAGVTMCPGRHFSTTVIMCLVAMVLLQYDVLPLEGTWVAPTKCNADLWNAMSKPDWEVNVKLMKRVEEKKVEWKFVWGDDAAVGQP